MTKVKPFLFFASSPKGMNPMPSYLMCMSCLRSGLLPDKLARSIHAPSTTRIFPA